MTAARKLVQCVQAAPYVGGVGVALVFFSWQGVLGGVCAAWIMRLISFPLIRRIHSRTVFAAWGADVDPGFTGSVPLVPLSSAPRALDAYDVQEGGSEPKDWLLAAGARRMDGKRRRSASDQP